MRILSTQFTECSEGHASIMGLFKEFVRHGVRNLSCEKMVKGGGVTGKSRGGEC